MTRTIIACAFATVILSTSACKKLPPLPPAQAHCASGVGLTALCAEWAGNTKTEQQECATVEGHWADGACPSTATASGGTCVVRAAEHTGTIRYGSGWKVDANGSSKSRAATHCLAQHGSFSRP